ncbi:aminotransferase class I/II-fold pyridoxal phosphate-dependent enzyme [Alicyclobacillus sp. TC]|uniref:aminotransferase class I/II-fold pyridoxal phosphate-dependent enzyme n=1 Tax=Alicyclobacillus sp. TC TaxID=2606450 RepID=UPI001EE479C0|nr:aminotransferase class I/II-fold pyridoxal phosphate-dependent enzyme [Alicyclobacillus sp. TC]
MTVPMSKRLATLETGIFAELALEKRRLQKNGVDIIDLSVGSPDMPPPALVMEKLADYVRQPANYAYSITGLESFSDAVAHFYASRYQVQLDPQHEVLQLTGTQEGLSHLPMCLLNEGDIALVPNPGYPIYDASIRLAGATPYPIPLLEVNHFLPCLEDIPEGILARAKMMIVNYPGNPVTALATHEFFEQLVAFAKRHDIFIVHDFAYSELVFDGVRPISFLSIPGAKEVGVEFNSLSKTFNMAGCRIGYLCGNRDGIERLALLKSHIDFGNFLPLQRVAIDALLAPHELFEAQLSEYIHRRDRLCEALQNVGWPVAKSPATMFIWAKIPDGFQSREFALNALREAGVAMTPGNAFGSEGEGYVRLALVQPVHRLEEAAQRIGVYLKSVSHAVNR